MSPFAVIVMLPDPPDDPTRADFVARRFDSWYEIPDFMIEIELKYPNWQLVSFCHSEDLEKLIGPPELRDGEGA